MQRPVPLALRSELGVRRGTRWTGSVMRRSLLAFASLALLSACAALEPGQDADGQVLLPQANAVLAAVNSYVRDKHRAPPDLNALVPKYLAALPAQPELNYSPRRGSLVFNYQPGWPDPRVSACQAHLGEREFHCVGIH